MLNFGIAVLVQLGRILLSFYGFWLIWRVLLPVLPGPANRNERIARFACYFVDPLAAPLVRWLRLPPRLAVALLLVADAGAVVALARVG